MPRTKPQPLSSDRALCERTCRLASALGWRLEHDARAHAYVFIAPNGKKVTGAGYVDQAAALASACRALAEALV